MTAKTLRAMVISAAMAAFGIALPIAFHLVGLGNKFLPMLLPLLLNGFLSPLPWAMLTGAISRRKIILFADGNESETTIF